MSFGRFSLLVPVVFVAACGRTESSSPPRLVQEWLEGDGGRVPRPINGIISSPYFYDTRIDAHCTSDGLHCLPFEAGGAVSSIKFSDPSCAHPVAVTYRDGDKQEPKYAYEYGGRGGAFRVFALGAPLYREAAAYMRVGVGEECVAMTGFAPEADVVVNEVTEVPLDSFAELRIEVEDAPNRLRPRVLVGPDGLRVPVGAEDTALGTGCAVGWDGFERWSCMPSGETAQVTYADATCQHQPLATVFGTSTAPKVVEFRLFGEEFCAPTRFAPITGAAVAPAKVYASEGFGADSICYGRAVSEGQRFYELGAPVPLATLEPRLEGPAGARLRPYVMVDGHGLTLPTQWFHDAKEGFDCAPWSESPLPDGTFTCRPRGETAPMGNQYTDAHCTKPIDLVSQYPCSSSPRPTTAYWRGAHPEEERVLGVHPVGAPFTGPVFRNDDPMKAGCIRDTRREDYGIDFLPLGPEAGTVTLAPLTSRQLPPDVRPY